MATLATVLGSTQEGVLSAVMADMTETPEGADAPPIYCEPAPEGPRLTPRGDL